MDPKNPSVTWLEMFALRTKCTVTFQLPLLYAFAGRRHSLIG